jgi:hypothetical protein
MKIILDKICRETLNTHFMLNNFLFLKNRALFQIMWKNMIQRGRPQMIVWHMRIAYWIPKATNTQTGCVIFVASPLQQCLHERASMFRYTSTAYLVH